MVSTDEKLVNAQARQVVESWPPEKRTRARSWSRFILDPHTFATDAGMRGKLRTTVRRLKSSSWAMSRVADGGEFSGTSVGKIRGIPELRCGRDVNPDQWRREST